MAETPAKNASDILQSYRRWKEEGEALKSQAQSFLVERFHELIQEAQQVQQDLWDDFGHSVKFPANPKFAKKAKARSTPKKATTPARPAGSSGGGANLAAAGGVTKTSAAQKPSSSGAPLRVNNAEPVQVPPVPLTRDSAAARPGNSAMGKGNVPRSGKNTERTLAQLTRQVEKARQRLEAAKASGSPVKIQNAEDRLYELSDELRLMTTAG